ncbi:MAG: hypothetical protein ACXABC_14865 [Candidatus Thorarchaeota archaeon]|jgi:hypothetical protein
MNGEKTLVWPLSFLIIMGLLYLTVGLIQLLSSIGVIAPMVGMSDPLSAIMILIISGVFFVGIGPTKRNIRNGYAYLAVGLIFAAVLFALQIIIIGTNAIGWLLQLEDWIEWNLLNDLSPSLWLFLIVGVVLGILRATGRLSQWGFSLPEV